MSIGIDCPLRVYYGALVLALSCYVAFLAFFFIGYFDPYYFTEARTSAHLQTVRGFLNGINPYDNAHLDEYGNLYSVVWPYLNYLVASALGLSGYFELKALMSALNALFILGAAATAFYVGIRNKMNLLLSAGIAFSFLLLNTTKMTMGEFSYGGGAAAGFLALLLANNRFDRTGFLTALFLVTLASLFKIYFAVFGAAIVIGYAAILPLRTLIPLTCLWLASTLLVYIGLTYAFPNYFEAIFGVVLTDIRHEYLRIVTQIGWFLLNFGFVFAFALPTLIRLSASSSDEQRRQIYYLTGTAIVSAYVIFGMSTNIGNFGTYLINLIAPMMLAYGLRPRDGAGKALERAIGVGATALLIATVFVIPKYDGTGTVRWTGWKAYGVATEGDLARNERTVIRIEEEIRNRTGASVFLDFPLAPIAIANGLPYIDTGNREFIARHKLRAAQGATRGESVIRIVSLGNGFDPVVLEPRLYMEHAPVVICMLRCPRPETHRQIGELGSIYMAYNAREFPVQLYEALGVGGAGD